MSLNLMAIEGGIFPLRDRYINFYNKEEGVRGVIPQIKKSQKLTFYVNKNGPY